jgi:hypothetical protein
MLAGLFLLKASVSDTGLNRFENSALEVMAFLRLRRAV